MEEDDAAVMKCEQTHFLEEENLCVVRSFETSARGIINRGDSVKRNRKQVINDTESIREPMETVMENGETLNGYDNCGEQQTLTSTNVPSGARSKKGCTTPSGAYKVLIIGDQGVGKTALINQFLTSDYMGGATDSAYGK